jgi:hypothetical protein
MTFMASRSLTHSIEHCQRPVGTASPMGPGYKRSIPVHGRLEPGIRQSLKADRAKSSAAFKKSKGGLPKSQLLSNPMITCRNFLIKEVSFNAGFSGSHHPTASGAWHRASRCE